MLRRVDSHMSLSRSLFRLASKVLDLEILMSGDVKRMAKHLIRKKALKEISKELRRRI